MAKTKKLKPAFVVRERHSATSISLPDRILINARLIAESQGKSFSSWLGEILEGMVSEGSPLHDAAGKAVNILMGRKEVTRSEMQTLLKVSDEMFTAMEQLLIAWRVMEVKSTSVDYADVLWDDPPTADVRWIWRPAPQPPDTRPKGFIAPPGPVQVFGGDSHLWEGDPQFERATKNLPSFFEGGTRSVGHAKTLEEAEALVAKLQRYPSDLPPQEPPKLEKKKGRSKR